MVRDDLLTRIPGEVMTVARRVKEAGHAVYVVGGALRDLLLGQQPADWDLATSARPEEMYAVFAGWRLIDVGARHGTLAVIPAGACGVVQVTTFRVEGPYGDHRRPDYVRFVSSLYEDLSRRDFTVNALALDPFTGELHDPWEGQQDIERGLVRAVGDAETRFREDALRPLRAFRLVAGHGWEIEPATSEAIARCASLVEKVAPERVRVELERILQGPRAGKALRLMGEHGLLAYLFPGAGFSRVSWDALDRLPPRVDLRLAALLQMADLRVAGPPHTVELTPAGGRPAIPAQAQAPLEARVEAMVARWRFPSRVVEAVVALVIHQADEALLEATPVRLRRWIAEVGRDRASDVARIAQVRWPGRGDALARRVRAELEGRLPTTVEELPVSGRDVMELLNLPPGPRVGQVLRELLEMVWDDPCLNDRETLCRLLRRRWGPDARA
ncbi:MAG: CCA tRNA nucleotidyltransferase [Bacillota bacterium]